MLTRIATLTACLLITACAPTRSITLTVTDDAGTPIHGARISIVPLATSDIPLPVTLETIGESIAKTDTFAITDERGIIKVTVLSKRPQAIAVKPPAFDEELVPLGGGSSWVTTPMRSMRWSERIPNQHTTPLLWNVYTTQGISVA